MEKKFLTNDEAEKFLGVCKGWLHKNRGKPGHIPYYQPTRRVFYHIKDLKAFLHNSRVEPRGHKDD